MLRHLAAAWFAMLSAAACAWADGPAMLPYRAYISATDVYVRSGPGENYYPVDRLSRGAVVDVYRHDPGGWLAVRPPEGSYSWISARYVEPTDGNTGVVVGDRVLVRVGSAFSDVRDVIQVRLDQGDEVQILEAVRFGDGAEAETWYRISPPAGEFRWVSGEYVSRTLAPSRQTGGERDELVVASQDVLSPGAPRRNANYFQEDLQDARAGYGANEQVGYYDDELDYERDALDPESTMRRLARLADRVREMRRQLGSDRGYDDTDRDGRRYEEARHDERRFADPRYESPDDWRAADNRPPARYGDERGRNDGFVETARSDYGRDRYEDERWSPRYDRDMADYGRGGYDDPRGWDEGPANDPLRDRLREIDRELSRVVADEPDYWRLAPLRAETDELLAQCDTAIERGRVRLVQRKIQRFEDIQQRHLSIATVQSDTDHRNAALGGPSSSVASSTSPGRRYDGTGRLTQVASSETGAASYALVGETGEVRYYVTPSPGVNLRSYVGREVGVSGTLGYMPDALTPHVTAKRIEAVEGVWRR